MRVLRRVCLAVVLCAVIVRAQHAGPGGSTYVPTAKSQSGPSGNASIMRMSVTPKGTVADTARLEWVRHLSTNNASGIDVATDVAIDASGCVYVTGKCETQESGRNYLTVKYDTHGLELWRVQYDGPAHADDVPTALAIDAAGNTYVTGMSVGIDPSLDYSSYDYATVKYNSAGQEQWVARYMNIRGGTDAASAIAVDVEGNVYVTGESDHADSMNGRWRNNSDFATIKYGPGGVQQWVARFNGAKISDDYPKSLALDDSGNVFVTGVTIGYVPVEGDFRREIVTLKYDPSGIREWAAWIALDSMDTEPAGIVVDHSGSSYIAGQTKPWGYPYTGAILTAKYSIDGNRQWLRLLADSVAVSYRANSLMVDHSGNIIVSGFGGDYSWYQDQGNVALTLKYDPAGDLLWSRKYYEPDNAILRVAGQGVDSDGKIYVAASTGPDMNLPDLLGRTILVFKYDASGNRQWVQRYDGAANSNNLASAIVVNPAGTVVVVGGSGPKKRSDFVAIKYQPSGTREWDARATGEGTSFESLTAMTVDAAGCVYVTGSSIGAVTSSDYITAKFDPSGNKLWSARYNSPDSGYDYPTAIIVDESGSVYVTGSSKRGYGNTVCTTVRYGPEGDELWTARHQAISGGYVASPRHMIVDHPGNVYVGSSGLVKYDNQGNQLWESDDHVYAMSLGPHNSLLFSTDSSIIMVDSLGVRQTLAHTSGQDIAVDDSGNVYVTREGWYPDPPNLTQKFSPAGSLLWGLNRGGGQIMVDRSGNAFVRWPGNGAFKVSSTGILQWSLPHDFFWGVPDNLVIDRVGNSYYSGTKQSLITGNPAFAVAKYDPSGLRQWSAQYDGEGNSSEIPYDLGVDGLGNTFLAGITQRDDFATEITLVKYSQVTVSVKEDQSEVPRSYSLFQNYPNPFNPTTTIQFALAKSGHVELKAYNTLGQEVATLVNEEKVAGTYSTQWNANNLASGIYFYRLQAGDFTQTRKLILLR